MKTIFSHPTVLLVEHGSTDFTAPGEQDRIHGTKYDLPLNDNGRKEVERSAAMLKDYDLATIEHSPMLRAKQSAQILARVTGVKAQASEELKPLDSGYLSGMTHGSAKARLLYYVKNPHKTIPDGESYGDWYEMYSGKLASKLKDAEGTPGKAHVLAVHSSEQSIAPSVIRGDPPSVVPDRIPASGQIAAIEKKNGRWRFVPKWEG